MKIKTLKIKVETENQDFDFKEFLTGSNTIHKTEATLKKEKGGFYWHVFITYEPKIDIDTYLSRSRVARELPKGFEEEIRNYMHHNPPNKIRAKNAISGGMDRLLTVKDMEGFKMLNKIGDLTLEQDLTFFTDILEIIKKYNADL